MKELTEAEKKRPEKLKGTTSKGKTACGNLYVTINRLPDGTPYEVFIKMGKGGGCTHSYLEALGRVIVIALNKGATLQEIQTQLKDIICHSGNNKDDLNSCSHAVSEIIKKELSNSNIAVSTK